MIECIEWVGTMHGMISILQGLGGGYCHYIVGLLGKNARLRYTVEGNSFRSVTDSMFDVACHGS
jgi:hypothetical protein